MIHEPRMLPHLARDSRWRLRAGAHWLGPLHAKVHTINAIRMRLAWRSSLLEPSHQTSSTPSFSSGLTTLASCTSRSHLAGGVCGDHDASTTICTRSRDVRHSARRAYAAIAAPGTAAVRARAAAARAGAREAEARAAPGHHADGHGLERRADRRGVAVAQGPHFAAGVESRAMNQNSGE